MIEARGVVVVGEGGRRLLDGVSVVLRPGCFTAVLGANGAGKTTLLRVLAGELAPDGGEVLLEGRGLAGLGRLGLARRRAVLGQHQGLEFGFVVRDVVELGRLPHAGTAAARDDGAAVAAAREAFGLGELWGRRYPSLSGGERQRVQLARVAAQLWGVEGALFLDEPTAALDLAQQRVALGFARRSAESGAAVLAVLHDLNQAALADEVLLLRGGVLLAGGPAGEVLRPEMLEACFGVAVEVVRRAGGGVGLLAA